MVALLKAGIHSPGLKLVFCLPSLYLTRLPLPAFALHNKLP